VATPSNRGAWDALVACLHRRSQVQRATGVLMEDLACPPGTAQLWLRCLARARGQSVHEVAGRLLHDRAGSASGWRDEAPPDR